MGLAQQFQVVVELAADVVAIERQLDQAKQRFDRLHRLSVIINGLQLLLLLAIAGWSLWGL